LGCPVVAAEVDGAREQLGDAARLVPPTDPAAIGRVLLELHRDPTLRSTLTERGLARARAFTTADYVRSMLDVLDELAPVRRTWP
jgi:glycosyltransferase involved in cell wall biosynthesis